MSKEDELRALWGDRYEVFMARAAKNYSVLSSQAKALYDHGGKDEVLAVALMSDEAYTDKRHPLHEEATKRVTEFFQQAHGDDEMIL